MILKLNFILNLKVHSEKFEPLLKYKILFSMIHNHNKYN
jgi:hypothetical protein